MAGDEELHWRKAEASIPAGNCVQVARLPGGGVAVRDSKDPTGPALCLEEVQWLGLTEFLRNGGEFSD